MSAGVLFGGNPGDHLGRADDRNAAVSFRDEENRRENLGAVSRMGYNTSGSAGGLLNPERHARLHGRESADEHHGLD